MMKYPFQQLVRTNARYSEALKKATAEVIDSGWYINGEQTKKFEEELAQATSTSDAIGTGNGLDALKLIMRGYMELGKLHKGNPLVAAGNTFIATVLPASELDLQVTLFDPDPATHCLNLKELAQRLDKGPGIIAVTHLYGNPAWDAEAAATLRARGWIIIEDNAQAIGARWHGIPTGSLGDASAISFYPAKNIGALGDAGAVCTNDKELAKVIRALRNYGGTRQYEYAYKGYNSRMDEMQAAMLRVKLRDLEKISAERNAAAKVYNATITHPDILLPQQIENTRQVWHQYVIRSPRRDELAEWLKNQGVGTLIHYPIPPHLQQCYKELKHQSLPISERLASEVLSLPIADITPDEAKEIGEIINTFPHKHV